MSLKWFQRIATSLMALALLATPSYAQRGGGHGGGGGRIGGGGGVGGGLRGGGGNFGGAVRGGGGGGIPRGNLGSVPSFSRPSAPAMHAPSVNRSLPNIPSVRSTPQIQTPRQTFNPNGPGLRGNAQQGVTNRLPNAGNNLDRTRTPDATRGPGLQNQLGNAANRNLPGNDRLNNALNNPNRTTVNRPDALGNRLQNNNNIQNNMNARIGNNRNFNNGNNGGFNNNNSPRHWNPYRYNGWNRGSWNVWGPGYAFNRYGYGYGGYGGLGYGGYGPWGGYGWYGRPWGRYAAIGLTSWALGSLYYNTGYGAYNNPYYGGGADYGYNYGQPIAYVASADPGGVPQAPSDDVATAFQAARDAFRNGDYSAALTNIDQAITKNPNDPALHEFRGLTFFALQRYREASAAVYAVLSVGPGMNWSSLAQLYPSVDVYTPQLRALEDTVRQNPQDPNSRFLLAYHYMTAGHTDAARTQFEKASAITPNDTVSRQMVRLLTPPETGATDNNAATPTQSNGLPPAAPPTESRTPVLTNSVGSYEASSGQNGSIRLNLREDGTFVWNFKQGDTPKEFTGKYTLEGNTLALEFQDGGGMVGTVEPKGAGFHFAVIDGPPNDPGLDFARK